MVTNLKTVARDCDTCDLNELNQIFSSKCSMLSEELIISDKYILHLTGTLYGYTVLIN